MTLQFLDSHVADQQQKVLRQRQMRSNLLALRQFEESYTLAGWMRSMFSCILRKPCDSSYSPTGASGSSDDDRMYSGPSLHASSNSVSNVFDTNSVDMAELECWENAMSVAEACRANGNTQQSELLCQRTSYLDTMQHFTDESITDLIDCNWTLINHD